MWAIRILSGPQAGQIFSLKAGKNKLGRSPDVQVQLQGNGISKEHLEIQVFPDKIIVSDLKSSNGSFLNGVRIQNAIVRMGDKMSAHNILFEIVAAPEPSTQVIVPSISMNSQLAAQGHRPPGLPQQPAMTQSIPEPIPQFQKKPQIEVWKEAAENYRDRVVLSGFIQLMDIFEFRMIMLGFAGVFILMVTLLSIVPMKQITAESLQLESRRRAQTVARALAQANEKVIRQGDLSNISTDFVLREDGIEDVYILSKDGSLIAPPERVGTRPRETGFIKQIMAQAREVTGEVGSGRVAAAYPIVAFNSELQQNVAKAYAVVIFNSGTLQFDDGRALSLFIQMLVISSLLGVILFYFMFKLIEHPWQRLTDEINQALRDNRDQIQFPIKFAIVQNLLTTVNSLLVRALSASTESQNVHSPQARDQEMKNICEMIGYPALAINQAGQIVSLNPQLESLANFSAQQYVGSPYTRLPDQAFCKNIESLMASVRQMPNQTQSDQFEISGHQLSIHCMGLLSPAGETDYFLVSLTPSNPNQGGG